MPEDFVPLDQRDVAALVGTFLSIVRDCVKAMEYLELGQPEAAVQRLANIAEFAHDEGRLLVKRLTGFP